ncbi:MAG TPA: glycosyltransferase family 2 protein [Casimicrobiaceae bacterium]|nr:glycosyltransferase family 2 protein [Casimicrobiaceae bacterium]
MRIAGVTVVRDEEDVVEASIRSNLRVLDVLVVLDHGSSDATGAILASLAAEGLPIEIARDDALEYRPPDVTTRLVREALARGADLCVPLEADEFLRVPSRAALEAAAASSDPALPLAMPEVTCIPDFDAPGDIVARLARAKRLRRAGPVPHRVIVRRSFGDHPAAVLADDHRAVLPSAGALPLRAALLDEAIASVAQVPVRGLDQYTAKVAVGHLSRLLGGSATSGASARYQEAFEAIVAGRAPTRDGLAAIAASWGLPPGSDATAMPADWVDDPFPADLALRYTPSRPCAPLARVLAFGERVAAEIAATTGGL